MSTFKLSSENRSESFKGKAHCVAASLLVLENIFERFEVVSVNRDE